MIRDLETSFKTDCFVPLQEDLDISAFQEDGLDQKNPIYEEGYFRHRSKRIARDN